MSTHLKIYRCLVVSLASLLLGCQPADLPIDVPQGATNLALASSVVDASTAFVTVTYSTNSLNSINDRGISTDSSTNLISKLTVSNALVVLSSATNRDTLPLVYPGLYGSSSLTLKPYTVYTLTVNDRATGLNVRGSCTYTPLGVINAVKPTVSRTSSETTVSLHVDVQDDPTQTDYYVMSYSKLNPSSVPAALGGSSFEALDVSSDKKLELFSDADAAQGRIIRDFTLNIYPADTLYTSISRIEKGYFDYLTAYKRSGSAFLDFGSEPVTLPTNVLPGLGYFFLNETKRNTFILQSY